MKTIIGESFESYSESCISCINRRSCWREEFGGL